MKEKKDQYIECRLSGGGPCTGAGSWIGCVDCPLYEKVSPSRVHREEVEPKRIKGRRTVTRIS